MKRGQVRVLIVLCVIVAAAGGMGCSTRKIEKEDEGQMQGMMLQEGEGDYKQEDGNGTSETEELLARGDFPEPVPVLNEDLFGYEVWKNEKTQIQAPGGILFDGENLLVCDMKNHCVVRLTTDGDFIESYGELGSETGNFVTPTAVLLYENEIYVLDSGNMRIQVFDTDMNYDREILFEGSTLPNGGKYHDFAIAGDGTIYVAADSSYGEGTSLFYIEDGTLCIVSGGVLGYLAERDGDVYAADRYVFYRYDRGYEWKEGTNWIYRVERDGLQKFCELPYMYAPADFVMGEDVIYTLSPVWGKMNQVSMEGSPLETMFYLEDVLNHDMYLAVQDENTYYVADTQGVLYKVFRTEGEE